MSFGSGGSSPIDDNARLVFEEARILNTLARTVADKARMQDAQVLNLSDEALANTEEAAAQAAQNLEGWNKKADANPVGLFVFHRPSPIAHRPSPIARCQN